MVVQNPLLNRLKTVRWNPSVNDDPLFSNERFKYRKKRLTDFVQRNADRLATDFRFVSCFKSRSFRVRNAMRSPWWSDRTTRLADASWVPDVTNRIGLPTTSLGMENTWFGSDLVHRQAINVRKAPLTSKYLSNAKHTLGNKELVRTVKCEMIPTDQQKLVFEKAIKAYMVTRSSCVRWIKKRKTLAYELAQRRDKINPLFDCLRSLFVINKPRGKTSVNDYFHDKGWMLEVPKEIRVSAVKDVVANLKSCLSNVAHGLQKRFTMKLKLKAVHCSFGVEKKLSCSASRSEIEFTFEKFFRRVGCSRTVSCVKGHLLKDGEPDAECKVHRDSAGRYFLLLAYNVAKRDESYDDRPIVAGDMGVRKFVSTYSTDGECHMLGKGCGVRIKRLLKKRSKITSVLAKKTLSNRERRKLENSFRHAGRKIVNLRDELHRKVANWLATNYSVIVLPKLRTKQLVNKETSVLGKMTKSVLMALAINKFYERLSAKCEVTHTLLIDGDECYTTKGCDQCGRIANVGSSETFRCEECGRRADRDVHSARNIFLKNTVLYRG